MILLGRSRDGPLVCDSDLTYISGQKQCHKQAGRRCSETGLKLQNPKAERERERSHVPLPKTMAHQATPHKDHRLYWDKRDKYKDPWRASRSGIRSFQRHPASRSTRGAGSGLHEWKAALPGWPWSHRSNTQSPHSTGRSYQMKLNLYLVVSPHARLGSTGDNARGNVEDVLTCLTVCPWTTVGHRDRWISSHRGPGSGPLSRSPGSVGCHCSGSQSRSSRPAGRAPASP